MPEQRDLRVDLDDVCELIRLVPGMNYGDYPSPQDYCTIAAHALERAIVAEEAVKRLVTVLNVHTNLCVFCPSGEIIAPPEYDSAGYRAWACKRNQPRDPEHLEECFADAMLTEAHAKAGL